MLICLCIKTIRLLDFIEYEKESAENELTKNLNWTAYEKNIMNLDLQNL